jgi:hypothetical protein
MDNFTTQPFYIGNSVASESTKETPLYPISGKPTGFVQQTAQPAQLSQNKTNSKSAEESYSDSDSGSDSEGHELMDPKNFLQTKFQKTRPSRSGVRFI